MYTIVGSLIINDNESSLVEGPREKKSYRHTQTHSTPMGV